MSIFEIVVAEVAPIDLGRSGLSWSSIIGFLACALGLGSADPKTFILWARGKCMPASGRGARANGERRKDMPPCSDSYIE